MTKPIQSEPRASEPIRELVHPLETFYARGGLSLPPIERIDAEAMPEPYKSLLVHDSDMTSTLETFHGGAIKVSVLGRNQVGMEYYREVLLVLADSGRPVEFGAIEISLDRFSAGARDHILREEWPLGRILKEWNIPFTSRPKAYLRLASDHLINEALSLSGVKVLYGRRNTLLNLEEESLAEIVEILPPILEAPPLKHGAS